MEEPSEQRFFFGVKVMVVLFCLGVGLFLVLFFFLVFFLKRFFSVVFFFPYCVLVGLYRLQNVTSLFQ